MNKQKHQPKNFFRYFLDEYILFRRDFYYELDSSLEIVREKIKTLNYLANDAQQRRIVVEFYARQGIWQFDLIAEQATRGGYSQSAIAVGNILEEDGKTILKGHVRLGGWFYQFLIVFMTAAALFFGCVFSSVIMAGSNGSYLLGFVVIFLQGSALYFWLRMYGDRNHLYILIQDLVKLLEYKARSYE